MNAGASSPRLATLPAIETEIWRELQRATQDKQHPWRTPVLATTDGEMGDARTVILREVDARQRQLMTFTDDRAGKVAQLLSHPRATMVMWSPALGWQLRCRVLLSLEMTGLAATSRWALIKLTPAAQDYLARLPPGAPLAQPHSKARAASPDDTASAPVASQPAAADAGAPEPIAPPALPREYFAVVSAQVISIDWLELHRDGHRRARFERAGAQWLQP